LDVPFTIADATTLTEAGYVGEDVESIIFSFHFSRKTNPTFLRALLNNFVQPSKSTTNNK
jgi:hypothetical protein